MKRILFILSVIVLLSACKSDEPTVKKADNKTVNAWLYNVMSELYYWNYTLPPQMNSTSDPATYFKTLKYKDDRFSALFPSYTEIYNSLNGVSAAEIGFEFQLYLESNANNNVVGVVSYIKYGTPAAKAGIKRGDYFRKINAQQMTTSNYGSLIDYLFDSAPSVSLTFATKNGETFIDSKPISVAKATNYQEDPVYLDSIYTIKDKKIGYLVYNFFTNDPGDNSSKYDLKLNTIFSEFKAANVNELIVDLRYNHGGMISSAVYLASMMVPNLAPNMLFVSTDYNANYMDYFNSPEFKKEYPGDDPTKSNFATTLDVSATLKTPISNIGNQLQRIFFLTGTGTASASEMVINGLKPFLPCVLIGDTTVGKNVGSTLVHDTNNPQNQWATMPIILKYFNKDHKSDFTQGFAPDFKVADNENNPLGDIQEQQLAKAISIITGTTTVPSAKAPSLRRKSIKSSADFKIVKNVLIVDKNELPTY